MSYIKIRDGMNQVFGFSICIIIQMLFFMLFGLTGLSVGLGIGNLIGLIILFKIWRFY